jgi:uncharacterized protein
MTRVELAVLIVIFFVTSAIGVVTGSNSLVAVPAMFQFGIEPRVAVATNMAGLVFMAIGGTIPFLRAGKINVRALAPLLVITAVGSALGAALVGLITGEVMKVIVSVAMFAVAGFILFRRENDGGASPRRMMLTFVLTFVLGVYGGLYSGGYVTILTAVLVAFAGMTFSEAVGSTKLINVVSSSIATAVFMWQGLIDYPLAAVLAVTMFVGGYAGAVYATKVDEVWLKRLFVSTVLILAVKTIYDLSL